MAAAPLQFDLSPDDQSLFLAELDELLQRVEQALVDLERAPEDRALLNEIFRAAHTIKGSSATIGHSRMAALTHAMETRLDDVRRGTAPVTAELIGALLNALDVLKLLRDEVETRVAANVDVDAAASDVERRAHLRARLSPQFPATSPDGGPDAMHRVRLVLHDSPWASVRALQALLALGKHGQVVSSQPSQAEIEREDAQVSGTLQVLVRSEAPEATLREALAAVPELASVVIEPVATASAPSPAPSVAPRATTGARSAPAQGAARTIRIDIGRLDRLLDLVGELVIDRTRLVQLGGLLGDQLGEHAALAELQQTAVHIGRITDELQQQVMQSRMLPIDSVFNRLPRVVRDIAARQGKQIDFIVEGKDTQLDRSVIEEIGDPLLHLIRNGVDHGCEAPEHRLRAGKSPTASLRLSAHHGDGFIVISLDDDGRGIDVETVKRKAVERGMISRDQAERMSDDEAVSLIFAPGLSTARELSDVSGRGVGLDVVRANVERINGSVEVHTRPGQGTRFSIRLPLTLATIQALLVHVAGGIYAVPMHGVVETLRVQAHQILRLNQGEAVQLRDTVLPLVDLREVFGLGAAGEAGGDGSRLVVTVRTTSACQVGLVVDGLVGEQEIAFRPLGSFGAHMAGISGAASLGDGSAAPVVDVAALIAQALRDNGSASLRAA